MFLKKGMQNQNVRSLQEELEKSGYDLGPADGIFGPRTESAVLAFQSDHGLSVDGVVGSETWGALFDELLPTIVDLPENTPHYSQCFDIFGDFRLAGWQEQNLVRCDLSPYRDHLNHIYYGWMTSDEKSFVHNGWFGFICHHLVAPHFQTAFRNIVERGLSRSIKTFDGCYNVRNIRGGSSWSTHSWAIAIDLNAKWNRFGQRSFQMTEDVATCFEEEGFAWGGRWIGKPDAMHFQHYTPI